MAGRVLIADDEQPFARLLSRLLGRSGFEAEVADPLEHLPRLYDAAKPDLLVVDWMLNGRKTGIDLALDLRSEGFSGPVILVSGHPEFRVRMDQRKLDRCWFLAKPFLPNDFIFLAVRLIGNGQSCPLST